MKNKKNVFALAIVALILVLGVGYAVVSQVTLTIEGNVGAADSDLKVVYNGVNSGTTTSVTAISSPDESKAATYTITGMTLNTPVATEFEIENKETDVNATISFPTITGTTSYFGATLEYKECNYLGSCSYSAWTSGTKTLNAGSKATIKVINTLTNTPIASGDSSATITVTYNATPAA